jgi:hypothetical protein
MANNSGGRIVVTGGHWMHIPVTRVYHRHYPEVRGEGRSLREALDRLTRLLADGLEHEQGVRREAIRIAIADVGAVDSSGRRTPRSARV